MTLRFLGTGNSFASIASTFFLGQSTVGAIVEDTCKAVANVLSPVYFRTPTTADEWREIAQGFKERWDVPHALGTLEQ